MEIQKDNTLWSLASFVKVSKTRSDILSELRTSPKLPSDLAKTLDIPFPTVSRSLKALEGKELIICLTPGQKKGRLYTTSEIGKDILAMLND
ncbi:MAG: winged helix-turn-helix domain-containing protein [Candidatus Hodarchaeales archaeon]